MKNLLRLFLASLVLSVAFTFTACDDDDGPTVNPDPEEPEAPGGEVEVSSNITEDVTWTSDNVYILTGRISVEAGATLTIEPGTIIKGQPGTGADAKALLIARGAQIIADGTPDAPIIFTSTADQITPEDVAAGNFASPNLPPDVNAQWGSVLILGNAPISASNDAGDVSEVQIEGIPTSDTNGLYGGNDPNDNSGVFRYVSIRHGGADIGAGNEINGLSLGGVGAGTTVENVEIVANADDGIEFFGGTVNVNNALIWNNGDDGIDTDQAWAGTLSNFVVVTPTGHCFELDGPEGSFQAGHTIENGTVIASNDSRVSEDLINFDDNSIVTLRNIFFTGIAEGQQVNDQAKANGGVVLENIQLDVPATLLPNYAVNGNTEGMVAGGSSQADLSVFGWTWASQSGNLVLPETEQPEAEVVVNSNITENTTWVNETVYILAGRIAVEPGTTLTIEPGTIIKGQPGTGADAKALLIARGAQIIAEGTPDAPIIFTSTSDQIMPSDVAAGNFGSPNLPPDVNAQWGSLIVLGSAPISASNDDGDVSEVQIEGIPTSDTNGLYGGNDPTDNSGILRYVSIRHGGADIGAGNEINGLSLGGVGNGTTVEHIEIVANADDGIEFFGGSVNVTNALVWNNGDDAIDTDQAWTGTLDNFIIVTPTGHCFELDGPEGSLEGGHTIQNGTVVASANGRVSEDLINFDDNSIVTLSNIFFTGIEDGQQINDPAKAGGGVVLEDIQLDVPATDLASFVVNGNTDGVTAGGSPQADASVMSWTWAAQAGGLDGL